jgi:YidC/Oxa1 family membrane protein insertase
MMQQDQESQRNLVLAIALSLAVLLGWQFLYAGPKARQEAEQRKLLEQQAAATRPPIPATPATTAPGATPATPSTPPAASTGTGVPAPRLAMTREQAVAASPRVSIHTPSLVGSINLRGGLIDDLSLVRYRETLDPKSPGVLILSPSGAPNPYFVEQGWIPVPGSGAVAPTADTQWSAPTGLSLTPSTPVTLSWDNGQGLTFRRTISVDDKYLFTFKEEIQNTGARETALVSYSRVYRFGTPTVEGWAILHEGLIGWIGDDRLQEIAYSTLTSDAEKNLKDKRQNEASKVFKPATGGWLGFTDKYWSTALVPPQDRPFDATFATIGKSAGQKEIFWANYQLAPVVVPAGQTVTFESRVFSGAKQPNQIYAYQDAHKIQRFDLMVDWGWFHFITKPMFWLIDKLYTMLGNFGLAILAVTVIVKAAFFPLQNKSYESMAKMKKLQPDMERIRDLYKNDSAKLQQEMMGLYKKHQVNPMAGCLPILLQIPVFFALYKVLFVTIDMRHAPFFGWIKDLSAPDPTSIFNLFGLLPFQVPSMLLLGVWPIIMGATMWMQMQLNPQQPDPLQQRIFNWMPVMFTFLLASFPAGLVIYWAWSNTLSFAQQYYITKKQGAEIHLWKNLGLDKFFGGGATEKKG